MITCRVHTPSRTYPVVIAPGGLLRLPHWLDAQGIPREQVLLLSDRCVEALYGEPLCQLLGQTGSRVRVFSLPPGEESKALAYLLELYDRALEEPIDRHTLVLALGGGVVGDVAGMLAATLLRGLPLVHVPTTLLAQVDSAIGGKAGVNHRRGKNLIGVIYQPHGVFIDPAVLRSLPEREWISGLAEVYKYALIADAELYGLLLRSRDRIQARELDSVCELVSRSVQVKACIVSEDETERGRRAVLNFGHTFGHALEAATGYSRYRHGEAIVVGMWAACWLSARRYPAFPWKEAAVLLEQLPVSDWPRDVSFEALWPHMERDKKRRDGQLRFVLLRTLGEPVLEEVSRQEAEEAWRWVRQRG
jgi:3-dehydroquinate synthase|nr:MAG: 3-dehydroquinate synthase [Bacteroidota bacterium]